MGDILIKLAKGEKITDEDIADGLYEICDREHSGCNNACPVYDLNGGTQPNTLPLNRGCDCFKNGMAMLEFVRSKVNLENQN